MTTPSESEREPEIADPVPPAKILRSGRRIRSALALGIGAIALTLILYRMIESGGLEQTAAMFVGLPALLAVALCLSAAAWVRSATGVAIMGVTLALLVSLMFLGEGAVCVLMAAPLMYIPAIIVGVVVDITRSVLKRHRDKVRVVVILPLLLASLEGVDERLSFDREECVTVVKVVNATPTDVERALAATPEFTLDLPVFLRLGFPAPVGTSGDGIDVGDRRVVRFAGGEGEPGDLTLEVAHRGPGRVRFRAVSDTSHISHWMHWRDATVSWRETSGGRTEVTWQLRYRRDLDPSWYFGPWERFGARLAAEHLIDSLATPRDDD